MLTQIKKAFQDALFPSTCQVCNRFFHTNNNFNSRIHEPEYLRRLPLEFIFQQEMALYLCPECANQFSPVEPPFCNQCGKMFESKVGDNHQCEDCIKGKKPYQTARSAGLLEGPLMESIHKLKYGGKIQLARPLGRLLFAAYMRYSDQGSIDIIIPVPLHPSRMRHRGFNQAQLLLQEWPELAKNMNNMLKSIDIDCRLMIRKRKTPSQTGFGKQKRRANVKDAFSVETPGAIKGKRVLLVDDVYTTGATTEECAKRLIKSGAETVHILTLARVA